MRTPHSRQHERREKTVVVLDRTTKAVFGDTAVRRLQGDAVGCPDRVSVLLPRVSHLSVRQQIPDTDEGRTRKDVVEVHA